jgi:hypothetical protein
VIWWALDVAATFTWLGMVLAISFLEAPLKFRAPGVTLVIDLGIGQLVFRALNTAEVVLGVVVIAAMIGGSPIVAAWWSVVALAALAAQLVLVRPRLRRRTAHVLGGGNADRSRPHVAYVGLEMVKVLALLVAAVLLLAAKV